MGLLVLTKTTRDDLAATRAGTKAGLRWYQVWEQDVLKSIAWIPFRVAKKVYTLVKEYSIMVAGAGIAYGGYLIFNGVLSPDLAPGNSNAIIGLPGTTCTAVVVYCL